MPILPDQFAPHPARDASLRSMNAVEAGDHEHRLPAHEAARFLTGLRRRVNAPDSPRIRVYGPEQHALLGSAHITAGELIPDRLLSPLEIQSL